MDDVLVGDAVFARRVVNLQPAAPAGVSCRRMPFFGHKTRHEGEWEGVRASARDDLVDDGGGGDFDDGGGDFDDGGGDFDDGGGDFDDGG